MAETPAPRTDDDATEVDPQPVSREQLRARLIESGYTPERADAILGAHGAAAAAASDPPPPPPPKPDPTKPAEIPVSAREGNWVYEGQIVRRYSPPPPDTDTPPEFRVMVGGKVDGDRDGRLVIGENDTPTIAGVAEGVAGVIAGRRNWLAVRWGAIAKGSGVMILIGALLLVTLGIVQTQPPSGATDSAGGDPTPTAAPSDHDSPVAADDPEQAVEDAAGSLTVQMMLQGNFATYPHAESRTYYLGKLATQVDRTTARAFVADRSLDGEEWTIVDLSRVEPPPSAPAQADCPPEHEASYRLLRRWASRDRGSVYWRLSPAERADLENALRGD